MATVCNTLQAGQQAERDQSWWLVRCVIAAEAESSSQQAGPDHQDPKSGVRWWPYRYVSQDGDLTAHRLEPPSGSKLFSDDSVA